MLVMLQNQQDTEPRAVFLQLCLSVVETGDVGDENWPK